MAPPAPAPPPRVVLHDDEPDELEAVLHHAQRLLVTYPVAAQAAFRAFVAEGRRFATTPEGQQWQARLGGSELVRRARVVWEVGTLNVLEEHGDSVVPSKILDAVVMASQAPDLEGLLARLFEPRTDDDAA